MHARLFETGSDRHLATGFDHSGGDAESLGPELGIAHPGAVRFQIPDAFPGLLDPGRVDPELGNDRIDLSVVKLRMPFLDPRANPVAFGTEERFSDGPQVFLGMKEVEDLNGFGEVFVHHIPDPESAVGDCDLPGDLLKLAAGGFPKNPLGKLGPLAFGIC